MGYRFELQHANMVAHLIDGNIETFLDLAEGEENYRVLRNFFRHNLEQNVFFSTRNYEKHFYRLFHELEQLMSERGFRDVPHEYLYRHLLEVSHLIGRSKVKGLLLSGHRDRFMTDTHLLERLVDIHPEDSCLILQISDLSYEKSVTLINAFRAFEEALKQFDKFPGVLLWDDTDTLFIPTNEEIEVVDIFERLLLERHRPLQSLKRHYSERHQDNDYIYLLHMSDLHLGKVTHGRKNELIRLIDGHSMHNDDVPILPIITGDLMDTPNQDNKNKVEEFLRELNTKFNHRAITILGNHDIDQKGVFSFFRKNKQATISLVSQDIIEVYEEYNLIIIKICSNQGGSLACGEVGEEQLINVGSKLDNIENINNYTLIAILHHHPIEIKTPDWQSKKWYEAILGSFLENTVKLKDSERFLLWCVERNIRTVLHGHEHIPNIQNERGVYCIASGSSTGNIKHIDKNKTYISYNLIKYDLKLRTPVQATIYFEDVIGTNIKHLKTESLV